MVVSSAAAVRRRLASLGARKFAPAAPAAHRGTERLLRAPGRADFRAAHAALFAAGRVDAVATGTNAAVAFLDRSGLFEDMGRDNDVSHYFVGRGRRGKTEEDDDFTFEVNQSGHQHCMPRALVSEGEKVAFAGLLAGLACAELTTAAAGSSAPPDGPRPLAAASVHLNVVVLVDATTLAACLETQLRSGAAADCFLVAGADTAAGVEVVREALRRCAPRRVRRRVPGLTGIYAEAEEETEVGFDVLAVVLREGEIHAVL